ncbi:hypothetical protein [uncultured Kiloniella sp.]|uniref:hypothetical protein n=1 Tax=uncultured Kiloniella sp. TaxID=1133091 RepID=UPI002608509A|nr:hypothetical protein [uncultured Kiloniella sp.]
MYSRDFPSPRYRQLIDFYALMHQGGVWRRKGDEVVKYQAFETFRGRGVFSHAKTIRKLANATQSTTLLDYGSGKGEQYSDDIFQDGECIANSLHEYWNVQNITCFDPAITDDQTLITKTYDGVIATNVLDLIPEEDLFWVIDLLFEAADKFVFVNVMDYSARTFLPNGENARVTRRSSIWWRGMFAAAGRNRPDIKYCIAFGSRRPNNEGRLVNRTGYLHNCQNLDIKSEKSVIPPAE